MMQTSVISVLSNTTSDKSFRLLWPHNKANSVPNLNGKYFISSIAFEINVV